jgi:hypothetical protein
VQTCKMPNLWILNPDHKPWQVTALAGALGRPICVISLSSKGMSDESLRGLLNSAAARCMLLLEVGSRQPVRNVCTAFCTDDESLRGLPSSAAARCVLLTVGSRKYVADACDGSGVLDELLWGTPGRAWALHPAANSVGLSARRHCRPRVTHALHRSATAMRQCAMAAQPIHSSVH